MERKNLGPDKFNRPGRPEKVGGRERRARPTPARRLDRRQAETPAEGSADEHCGAEQQGAGIDGRPPGRQDNMGLL